MKKITLSVLLTAFLITACGTGETPAETIPSFPLLTDNGSVIAEGQLLPKQFANLAFGTGGKVAEVLVVEGQAVEAGDMLARLESSDSLAAQMAQARADLLMAQQALDDLNDAALLAVARAQAESDVANAKKVLDEAERKLKNLNYPDLEWYQEQVTDAQDALTTAQENAEVIDIGSLQAALQSAQDSEETLRERLDKVKAAAAACPTCDPEGSFTVDGFSQSVADAQDDYNGIINRIKELEIQIAQAERNNNQAIKDAQEAFDDAQQDLSFAQSTPKPLDLEVAQANVALWQATLQETQSRLAKLQAGPDPDQFAAATARLEAAQAALTAAENAFQDSELRSPFEGIVADVRVKVGEAIVPTQPAIVVADVSNWIVETDNLTEIEVVELANGQPVTVVLDALPDLPLLGTVTAISPAFEEKRGDITYTVTITINDNNEAMRWGMTAVTTFE